VAVHHMKGPRKTTLRDRYHHGQTVPGPVDCTIDRFSDRDILITCSLANGLLAAADICSAMGKFCSGGDLARWCPHVRPGRSGSAPFIRVLYISHGLPHPTRGCLSHSFAIVLFRVHGT
jgi:hypothetical protein